MLTLIRAPLRLLSSLRGCGSTHVLLLSHGRQREAGWTAARRAASVPGHSVHREAALGVWRTGGFSFRCYSARRAGAAAREAVDKSGPNSYTSMVDPETEEQFVFLDVDAEDEHLPQPNPRPNPTSTTTLMEGHLTPPKPTTTTLVEGHLTPPKPTTTTLMEGHLTPPKPTTTTLVEGHLTPPKPTTTTLMEGHMNQPNPTSNTTSMAATPAQVEVTLAEKHRRTLEQQLRSLRSETEEPLEPDPSSIQFTDVLFPLDPELLKTSKTRRKNMKPRGEHKVFGSPDVEEPCSSTCCSGCGALLHCTDPGTAGYMPSEKFKPLVQEDQGLRNSVCQRCYLLTHHKKALEIKMSKEDYRNVVRGIRPRKALVLLIVDLLDLPDSMVPDLLALVGRNKHLVVLGNKVDLLPQDAPNYLQRLRRQLSQYCTEAGLGDNVKDVHLISAKTGYGVEQLISALQRSWKYQGDVYLVGTANAGKSTLFNTLLDSDYCKSRGSEVIHKATISPWPGTTLNLLKFPIINPTPYRMFRRQERLQAASSQTEGDLSPEELKRLQHFSKQGYLVGRVGRTFRVQQADHSRRLIEFDPDSLAYGGEDSEEDSTTGSSEPAVEFSHNELKDAHWLYDTPGIMKERDLLSLLTEEEVKVVVASRAIVPRTYVLKPGMSLFLGALGRVDYLQGEKSCWLSVVASNLIPVHITSLERSDSVYLKHAGHALLGVPMGGSERMQKFPPLQWEEFTLEGQGHMTASADITMSSAGWVSVTGLEGERMLLRAHRPQGTGGSLRTPPLLPHIANVKGERLRKSAAYKTAKPPALVDTTLSHQGATRLTVKKKKKKKRQKDGV